MTTVDDTPSNANCTVGSCTLRQAINASNLNDPGVGNQNAIQFAVGVSGPIGLVNGTLFVSKDMIITGPTSGAGLSVDGNHAVGIFSIAGATVVTISNLTIANGSGSFGGGVANHGTLTLTNVSLIGDVAANSGGGIYNDSTGTLTIANCTFSGNSAHAGGGIYTQTNMPQDGTLNLTNTTVSGNTARNSQGGGLFAFNTTVTLTNTIIAANTDPMTGNAPDDITGAVASGSLNNLIGTGGSGGLMNGTNGNLVNVAAPLLGPLGLYGSASGAETLPLLPGSPAIDAGTATGAPSTDQRGMGRMGGVDIGAFESRGFTLVKTSGDNQTQAPGTAFAPLVVTVSSGTGEPVQGGVVTFTGPLGSPGIQGSPLAGVIAANGQASVAPIADATAGGPYAVVASASGANGASFSLTNGLTLTGISPSSGSVTGGGRVTLTGKGFGTAANTQVLFNGSPLPAGSVTAVSATAIIFIAPTHAAGTVTITVIVLGNTATGSVMYQYGPVAPLPTTQLPGGSPSGTVSPLPPARPSAPPVGSTPSPLPAPRP